MLSHLQEQILKGGILHHEKNSTDFSSDIRSFFAVAIRPLRTVPSDHAVVLRTDLSAIHQKADSETDLGTVSSYIATKFRQHDVQDGIFTDELNDIPALCFRDTINNQDYITYLYLDDGRLKELFTADGSSAQANAGTAIASLSDFQIEENANGFYHIFLQSTAGDTSEFYLHSCAA